MKTLEFQPNARRYYDEGHWRDGDLWSDFAARADEHPERVALMLDEQVVTYDQLRRAAYGISRRLAEHSPGSSSRRTRCRASCAHRRTLASAHAWCSPSRRSPR